MFYAHFVLSKKGALARIWLAAHWDKKLTKAHIFETNIESSVEAIMRPQVKLALRTSGHLLLGVVRIYSRKAKYLLADCGDAIVKMKMVFRPGAVDLPEDGREAPVTAVTIPENFYEFDAFLPSVMVFDPHTAFDVYQSHRDDITLREDFGAAPFTVDDGFGDIGFDDEVAEASAARPAKAAPLMAAENSSTETAMLEDRPLSPVVDRTLTPVNVRASSPMEVDRVDTPKDVYGFVGEAEVAQEFGGEVDHHLFAEITNQELFEAATPYPEEVIAEPETIHRTTDQTTLMTTCADAFALGPIDATTLGTERKTKKKRKLIIDDHKLIPSDVMRAQLKRSGDLIVQLDLAPPTKKLMDWKAFGGVDKLLMVPGKRFVAQPLSKLFSRNLVTRTVGDDEDTIENEPERTEEAVDQSEQEINRETRRGASVAGEDVRDMSRMSALAPVDVTETEIVMPQVEAVQASVSLPWADASAVSATGDLSEQRMSLPEVEIPSFIEPPLASIAAPDLSAFDPSRDSVFEQTLPSATADTTLISAEDIQEESQLMCQRSSQLLESIRSSLGNRRRDVIFADLIANNSRKQVAAKFYTLLVLKKQKAIDFSQKKPYADIRISKGPAFADLTPVSS